MQVLALMFTCLIRIGIFAQHVDFGGRVILAHSIFPGESPNDTYGTGTHSAGIIGGTIYGVAKQVRLHAVKILSSGHGSIAGVVAGINFITGNKTSSQIAIAVFTLTTSPSTAIDNAVQQLLANGIYFVNSGGADNVNACNYSPLRVASVLGVGSITNTSTKSSFSNYGPCIALYAPGQSITSDGVGSINATYIASGPGASASFAAGVLAVQLSISPSRGPSFLVSQATPMAVGPVLYSPTS